MAIPPDYLYAHTETQTHCFVILPLVVLLHTAYEGILWILLCLQGNGLGFRIIRMGYDDIYLSCPGSSSERFGKEYFICTGPASMLVPIVLKPGEEWRGAQVLEHDNL